MASKRSAPRWTVKHTLDPIMPTDNVLPYYKARLAARRGH